MLVNIFGAKCIGIDAVPVTVEVDVVPGIGIHLVGLADVAVRESLLRTITALQSLDFRIPGRKIVINLAPADIHKSGSGFDVPIALGIIAASGQKVFPSLDKYLIMGELGLDGTVRSVSGALPIVELAIKQGFKGCILPLESALEALEFRQIPIYGVRNLPEVIRILSEEDDCGDLLIWNSGEVLDFDNHGGRVQSSDRMDFSEIVGQDMAKRGAEIACSGGHNVIMVGPMGAGKTSLAKAMAAILPPMTMEEAITTSKIYSVAGTGNMRHGLIRTRPFRAPHYSASLPAIIGGGGGDSILPGEVSLAENGILFLDEFCLAPKSVMEALRGPVEDRQVVISRLRSKVRFPSSFMLVAATNPCPCGYWGEGDRCTCTPGQRASYLSRLNGPLIDRIDLQIWMHQIDSKQLINKRRGESSAEVARRVEAARQVQEARFQGSGITTNAEMNSRQLEEFCFLSGECRDFLEKLISSSGMSARAYGRIVKLARTIADMDTVRLGKSTPLEISVNHLSEASSYRFLDRRPEL